jgi:multidrug efflux system membrane fusion protein
VRSSAAFRSRLRAAGRPRAVIAAAVVAPLVLSVYLALFGWTRGSIPSSAGDGLARVPVQRATITTQKLVNGTLGYRASVSAVRAFAGGVVESTAAPGALLGRGSVLYRLGGEPIILLYGSRPAWRTLVAGMTGQDVRELNANLAALGYLPRRLRAAASFGAATEQAVRRLQARVGAEVTGLVVLDSIVFRPGKVRVGAVQALAGGEVQAGSPVMQVASADKVVKVDLDVAERADVHLGDHVSIVLPSGAETAGSVSSIARVAEAPQQTAAPGGGGRATVAVTVRLGDQRAVVGLDQAPVQVAITTATAQDALAVPIAALLAQPDGTYVLQVVRAGVPVTVPVTTGLFSDASDLVAITSGDVRVGDRVLVPQ